ncbi:Flagellar hook capping protein [Candidatus Terasakiella magnetica]|nr:Flagellar hook capping protein [Candidatus Terasakiella magnetica]
MTTAVTGAGANTAAIDTMANSTGAAASTSKSATSKATLGTNFNTFLNMLTTQLKHQDPLSPMDSTQFTNQLVQFSSVEQQINANSNLETLIGLQKTNLTSSAIPYLGQTVETAGGTMALQDGQAGFSYTLPSVASAMTVSVKDSSGRIVATLPNADPSTGRHEMTWDGKDDSGTQLKDGKYSVEVTATGADGASLTVAQTAYGRVTDVANDATNGTQLKMGDIGIGLDKILTVKDTASAGLQQQLAAYQQQLAAYQAAAAAAQSATSGN